jgi:pyruvate/2-oxoglutarate dehydrogenase complex dihydrolipoamide acyltransferase (E2) component
MSHENYETALPEAFDPATEKGTTLVPVGTYVAQITDASVSQPKSGDGYGINLTWQIDVGEYQGFYVWQRLTFLHSSVQATVIGRRQFKDLCVATGVDEQVTDVSVFKYIPCQIRVGIEQDKQGVYADKNKVSRILPFEQPPKAAQAAETKKAEPSAAATTATTAAPKPAAVGANGTTPPWRKPKPSLAEDLSDEIPYNK